MQVLIVEDDSLQRIQLKEVLEEAGFEVLSASAGDVAIEALGRAHATVSAVVTDVQMPGSIDGIELARVVRERWPHIGVVVLSGFSQSAQRIPKEARLLHKPVNELFLVAMIHRIIETCRAVPVPAAAGAI